MEVFFFATLRDDFAIQRGW